MTLWFGIAQVIAPAVIGVMATHLGGYRVGLYLASAAMLVGVVLLVVLRLVDVGARKPIGANSV